MQPCWVNQNIDQQGLFASVNLCTDELPYRHRSPLRLLLDMAQERSVDNVLSKLKAFGIRRRPR